MYRHKSAELSDSVRNIDCCFTLHQISILKQYLPNHHEMLFLNHFPAGKSDSMSTLELYMRTMLKDTTRYKIKTCLNYIKFGILITRKLLYCDRIVKLITQTCSDIVANEHLKQFFKSMRKCGNLINHENITGFTLNSLNKFYQPFKTNKYSQRSILYGVVKYVQNSNNPSQLLFVDELKSIHDLINIENIHKQVKKLHNDTINHEKRLTKLLNVNSLNKESLERNKHNCNQVSTFFSVFLNILMFIVENLYCLF